MNEQTESEQTGTMGDIVRGFLKALLFVFGGYVAVKQKSPENPTADAIPSAPTNKTP